METRPKRRKYKDNPYSLDIDDNIYKVIFVDSNNILQNIEVELEIFEMLDRFELDDLSEMNEYDRHIEHLNFDDIAYQKIEKKPMSLEDEVINNIFCEYLKREISKLPEIQRRRLVLYFFYDMTLEEIGIIENCSPRAVKDSIDISVKKLHNLLKI